VTTAAWLPYALPLCQPWQSGRGSIALRRGRLRRLDHEDGTAGWGDCAPLPAFGIDAARATAFAEESAHLDLAARHAGKPLAVWLGGDPAITALAVNAHIGPLTADSASAAAAAWAAGFTVLKLKVGIAPVADDIARLHTLSAALPDGCRLRLDANGAWDMIDAARFLAACRELPVEACEEPLRAPDLRSLTHLQAATPFALAVDESLVALGDDFFRHPPVRRLVIKPARLGGLWAALSLARQARAAGIEIVISSALESSCGLLASAHLAAAAAPEAVHGLATAAWFACDTGEPPRIERGRLLLPPDAGLGFRWAGARAPAFTGAN
jgi:O-succinylbenzoate synthase